MPDKEISNINKAIFCCGFDPEEIIRLYIGLNCYKFLNQIQDNVAVLIYLLHKSPNSISTQIWFVNIIFVNTF